MKFTIIATLVVLALAHGSLAQEVSDLERITQYFEQLKTKMTEELNSMVNNQELTSQAQTFLEDKKAQLEPLAAQIQEQLNTAAASIESQVVPLATSMQAQMQPLIDKFQQQMETLLKQLNKPADAITN